MPSKPSPRNTRVKVKHISIDLANPDHPTGEIKGGYIALQGLFKSANLGINTACDPDEERYYLIFDGQKLDDLWLSFDEAKMKSACTDTLFCLPVLRASDEPYCQGLILVPTGKKTSEYSRFRIFQDKGKEWCDIIKLSQHLSEVSLIII
jgi:hypothetical protein